MGRLVNLPGPCCVGKGLLYKALKMLHPWPGARLKQPAFYDDRSNRPSRLQTAHGRYLLPALVLMALTTSVALAQTDFWPSATTGAKIGNVTINGGQGPQTVPPGSDVAVTLDYTIIDVSCPGCIDQIQYGIVTAESGAGNPVLGKCLYDGVPGPKGASGSTAFTIKAPVEPGSYALAFDRAQEFSCSKLTKWWNGQPRPAQYFARIEVASSGNPSPDPVDPFAAVPPLKTFSITPGTSKVLPGRTGTDPTDDATDPNGGITPADTIGDFALAGLLDSVGQYQNTVDFVFNLECGNGPGFQLFSDGDWKVEQGVLKGVGPATSAYTVHKANRKAVCFPGTRHGMFYKFATREDHTVHEFRDGKLNALLTVRANDIVPGEWTRLGELVVNDIQDPVTFVIAPASTDTSPFSALGEGVEGATIADTPVGRHVQIRYTVPGKPFDTERDFVAGPADPLNIYGQNRAFFPVTDGTRSGVVWQSRDTGAVFVTWFGSDPATFETKALPAQPFAVLAAATSDAGGTLYTFMIQAGNGACPRKDREATPPVCTNDVTRVGTLFKADANGNEIMRRNPDMGPSGLDVVEFGRIVSTRWVADMQYANGLLGLMLARLTHMTADGLNHQSGVAAVFDANTLQLSRNHGQTSGHSWENVLTLDAAANFLGVDIGDNFPRGVHLHRFDAANKGNRVLYTYKTLHGQTPNNPAGAVFDVFNEISDGGTTFYQWSNDNRTYAELGGVVDTPRGILAVFSSERSGLDNRRAIQAHNDPRNLALMIVRRDFENASSDPENPTVVADDLVLSKSDYTVTGGYFTFTGDSKLQRNTNVVWLTDYADTSRNASRVKMHPLDDNEALILWELWGPKAYTGTWAMSVRSDGTISQSPVELSRLFRLNRRDDVFDHAGQIYSVAGDGASRQLILNVLVRSASK
ncbi:MAG: hypothetical protein U9R74_11635 [Pseudomonadota bacterium]|nr:hypothetical protein [Pseudomonadota bacterium]